MPLLINEKSSLELYDVKVENRTNLPQTLEISSDGTSVLNGTKFRYIQAKPFGIEC